MIAERFALAHLKKAEAIGEPSKVFVAQTREGAGLLNFYEGILSALQAPRTRARDTMARPLSSIVCCGGCGRAC